MSDLVLLETTGQESGSDLERISVLTPINVKSAQKKMVVVIKEKWVDWNQIPFIANKRNEVAFGWCHLREEEKILLNKTVHEIIHMV